MIIRSRNFGLLGAAGGCFGLDLGAIWASIFAPEARSAILVKNSTALRREHDFQVLGGSKKGPKWVRKRHPTEAPLRGRLGALSAFILGPSGGPGASQNGARNRSQSRSEFRAIWGAPRGGPGRNLLPPGEAKMACFGARGETTEGGT